MVEEKIRSDKSDRYEECELEAGVFDMLRLKVEGPDGGGGGGVC